MSEAVISSLITGILALIGVYAANRKAAALMEYRLQQLEEKVNKHNNLIERMYAVEEKTTILDFINMAGFDGVTHYNFFDFAPMNRTYTEILEDVKLEWEKMEKMFDVPYYPHISVGWDTSPRYNSLVGHVVRNNTPENVKKGFEMAKAYIDSHPDLKAPLVTVNSWNEWTETSYLEPDDLYGYGYLEAIKETFIEN